VLKEEELQHCILAGERIASGVRRINVIDENSVDVIITELGDFIEGYFLI